MAGKSVIIEHVRKEELLMITEINSTLLSLKGGEEDKEQNCKFFMYLPRQAAKHGSTRSYSYS